MSKHTPGPWKISPYSSITGIAIYGGGIVVAGVRGGEERSNADARLIAAAPELLEALQTLTTALAIQQQFERGRGMKDADAWTPLIEAARAALAKANWEGSR